MAGQPREVESMLGYIFINLVIYNRFRTIEGLELMEIIWKGVSDVKKILQFKQKIPLS